jgi:hypothetical protein
MHKNIYEMSRLHYVEDFASLSLLRIHAAIAGRMVGGVAPPYDRQDAGTVAPIAGLRPLIGSAVPRSCAAPRHSPLVPARRPSPLLVTSSYRLYLLERDSWHYLLPVICFGVARERAMSVPRRAPFIRSVGRDRRRDTIDRLRNVKVLARFERYPE